MVRNKGGNGWQNKGKGAGWKGAGGSGGGGASDRRWPRGHDGGAGRGGGGASDRQWHKDRDGGGAASGSRRVQRGPPPQARRQPPAKQRNRKRGSEAKPCAGKGHERWSSRGQWQKGHEEDEDDDVDVLLEDEEEEEMEDDHEGSDSESAEGSDDEGTSRAGEALAGCSGSTDGDRVHRELLKRGAEPAVVGKLKRKAEDADGVEMELFTPGAAKKNRLSEPQQRRSRSGGSPFAGSPFGRSFFDFVGF
eukprot:TRINITY_DN45065_c0_g1_i1.p1 TRINITY_DN45065_c0_g1~~TRINITY_DN45065_c0_g1_i1.p1  ORF type:complete len:249 (+),score=73.07 TRINITY_DN45065_c0_g1_i1:195-941(+)